MRFTVAITLLSLAVLAFFILAAIFSGKLDFNLWTNIAKDGAEIPGGGGRAPVRDQRDLQVVAVRDLVLPGDRGGAARGGGVHGPAPRRPEGIRVGHAHAADRRDPHPGLQHGAAGRGLPVRRRPGSRCSTACTRIFGQNSAYRAPRAAVHDRPGGQLLHDHLRVRPEHVLAVAGGLLPEVPLADPRRAEDPARRADRGGGRRVRRVLPRLGPAAAGPGRADRGGAAQHGGVRGGDLVHHADGVVRPAPREAAEHRAAVPEQVGRPGRGDRRAAGRDLARRDLPRTRRTGPACYGVAIYYVLGRPVLRDRRAEPAGAVARGGVRAHAGRDTASRRRRDTRRAARRAGGDPRRRGASASSARSHPSHRPDAPSG